jgi:DNA replication protein DnaC
MAPSMKDFEDRQREKYMSRAGLPVRFQEKALSSLVIGDHVRLACEGLVARVATGAAPIGVGLLLHGSPGRGKSTVATATLREVIMTASREALGKDELSGPMLPGYYLTYTELISEHKTSWGRDLEAADVSEDLLKSLYGRQHRSWWNTRLLVLDDVGKEHSGASGFTVSTLHDLLRSRYDKGFPTIITTNLEPADWEVAYGEAMYSFIHEAFDIVDVGGRDRRRA